MRRFILAFLCVFPILGCDAATQLAVPRADQSDDSIQSQSPLRVYFTDPATGPNGPNNPAKVLKGIIETAKTSIDVCAFELDNVVITDALVRAVQRGVKIRLVTESDYLDESGIQTLKSIGVPVVDDQRQGALMHNKFMIFDGKSVWMGSMNFTENCVYKNNNHGIYIDDSRIAANYATKFSWMFEKHKFGGTPSRSDRIPHPQVTLSDGTPVENYFSTHDHVADRLTERIRQAKSTIHFLAFSFTHDGMGVAMLDRANAGCQVLGVFERTQAAGSYTEYGKLKSAAPRALVYLDANPRNMHHKFIILDGETTVAGSFNFSDGADKQNDENVVIIRSRSIAQQFEQEFQRVYGAAQKAEEAKLVGSR